MIFFLPKYTQKAPSSRYRTYKYIPFLKASFETKIYPFFNDAYVSAIQQKIRPSILVIIACYFKRIFVFFSIPRDSVIVVEKEIFPYVPFVFERFGRRPYQR